MERQLANLTGLVQKALHAPRVNRALSDLDSGYRSDRETYYRTPSGECGGGGSREVYRRTCVNVDLPFELALAVTGSLVWGGDCVVFLLSFYRNKKCL